MTEVQLHKVDVMSFKCEKSPHTTTHPRTGKTMMGYHHVGYKGLRTANPIRYCKFCGQAESADIDHTALAEFF